MVLRSAPNSNLGGSVHSFEEKNVFFCDQTVRSYRKYGIRILLVSNWQF